MRLTILISANRREQCQGAVNRRSWQEAASGRKKCSLFPNNLFIRIEIALCNSSVDGQQDNACQGSWSSRKMLSDGFVLDENTVSTGLKAKCAIPSLFFPFIKSWPACSKEYHVMQPFWNHATLERRGKWHVHTNTLACLLAQKNYLFTWKTSMWIWSDLD